MSIGAGAALVLGLGAPQDANACDPYIHIEQFWPTQDEPFPADGVFFATGAYLEALDLVARVDGEEVPVEILERFTTAESGEQRSHVGLRPTTLLEVGSTIAIIRCDYAGCQQVASWIVGEPAQQPPPLDAVHTAMYTAPDCGSIGCTSPQQFHGAMDVFLTGAAPTAPRFSVVRLRSAVAPFEEIDSELVNGSVDAARVMIASPFAEESPVADGLFQHRARPASAARSAVAYARSRPHDGRRRRRHDRRRRRR